MNLTEIEWSGMVSEQGPEWGWIQTGSCHMAPLIPGVRRNPPARETGEPWADWCVRAVQEAVTAMREGRG